MRGFASRRFIVLCLLGLASFSHQALGQGEASPGPAAAGFAIRPVDEGRLGIWDLDRPVLVYNHGMQLASGVPSDRRRSSYIHPLHGLDGEVITADFPVDHYHHRGLFWAWPHVRIGAEQADLWLIKGIEQRFEGWLARQASAAEAVLGVQNGWYIGDRRVVDERVWIRVGPADEQGRPIDLDLTWTPIGAPLSLTGAEGKSYGGLTLRYAPGDATRITVPSGVEPEDLYMAPLPWADLTRTWTDGGRTSGAAILIPPGHPDFPPTWLTRHYGVLCVGWPGVEPREFPANQPIHCAYRVWIHRGASDPSQFAAAHQAYAAGPAWVPPQSD